MRLYAESSKCSGPCVPVACSLNLFKENKPEKSRAHNHSAFSRAGRLRSQVCTQAANVRVCPTNAIKRNAKARTM